MADFQKIAASTYLLWIDPAGGTTYDLVACLNNFGLSGSVSTNDASTMCGPGSTPGTLTYDIALDAVYIINPDTGIISAPGLFDLFQNRTSFTWKIGPAIPAAGDVTKTGAGYLSKYDEKFDKAAPAGFSGTITVDGLIDQDVNGS